MNFGSIFKKLFAENADQSKTQGQSVAPDSGGVLARQFFEANQGGATDGSGMADLARLWDSTRAQPMPAPAPAPAPAPQGVSPSTMQLIGPPQAGSINITPPTGTKPKNYVPAQVSMTAPMPTALARLGLGPAQISPFQLTLPQGTKPKNYRPASMTMTPPSAVGPEGLMQVLAMMRSRSPFGTDGGMG
jgi:hypothetical protein